MKRPPVLLCTGFHRSATSVTAQWLSRAGLPLWLWEMGAHFSNPKGHFEDWAAVDLHDALLTRQGLDWQFADDAPWFPEAGIEALSRYVARRDAHCQGKTWGMKDPRTCLFLPAWHEVLGERGRYLFVLRHWGACVDSLLRRHSSVPPKQLVAGRQHLAFWERPTLGARMWLAYNRRLLAFAEAHPDLVLLVTQKKLFASFDLPTMVHERLGVQLQAAESPVQSTLLNEQVDRNVARMIPPALEGELDDLWQALLDYCDCKSDDEAVHWREPEEALSGWVLDIVEETDALEVSQTWSAASSDLTGRLEWLLLSGEKLADVRPILEAIEYQDPFNAGLWEKLAWLALRNSKWEVAEYAMERVLSFGESRPYHSMMLGDARRNAGDERAAEVFYQKARRSNPKNEQFHQRLARLRMLQGRHVEAEEVLDEGLTHFDAPPELLRLLWCECLEQQGRREEAMEWLRSRDTLPEGLAEKLAAMEMAEGLTVGEERLRHLQEGWARLCDPRVMLEQILRGVVHQPAREDLARRVCQTWERRDVHAVCLDKAHKLHED